MSQTTDLEQWRQTDLIFQLAVERPPEGRDAFLDAACGHDEELRRRVESLLRLDAAELPLLDRRDAFPTPSPAIRAGDPVGSYRVVRLLGEGGSSVVYEARRADGRLERRVAVKVLKLALFSPEALQRFVNEGHLLARLKHENIAQVYDAGTTENGFPFLVMELVEGRRIDDFCLEEGLSLRARLELFRRVCAAVSHAHRNLIVHRDIKPSNILVTEDGRPKLLDFGIAKLLSPSPSAERSITRTASQPLTPQYASPEQLAGKRVTTASDVYSLGLLLYELLTGDLPYRLEGGSPEAVASFLSQRPDPPTPSSQLRLTPAESRISSKTGLRDLDRIVAVAVDRDASTRYPSVAELSSDLERYLSGYPVQAREPSVGYLLSRFIRRHRTAVAFAATALLTLLAFISLLLATTVRLREERERARSESERADEATGFLVDLFESAEPAANPGRRLDAQHLLEIGEGQLESATNQRPEQRAAFMAALGRAYLRLSHPERARPLLEGSLDLFRQVLSADDPAIADALDLLSELEFEESSFDRAAELAREAVAWRERTGDLRERVAASQINLASALMQRGEREEAHELLTDALELAGGGRSTPLAGRILRQLGIVSAQLGRSDEAEGLLRRAITIEEGHFGHDHPNVLDGRKNLLLALAKDPTRHREAAEGLSSVLADERRVFGEHHLEVALTLTNLASLLTDLGHHQEAAEAYREAQEVYVARFGEDHYLVGVTLLGLAVNLEAVGEYTSAETHLRESAAIFRQRLDASAAEHAHPLRLLAVVVRKQGRPGEAEALAREALAVLGRTLPGERWLTSLTQMTLGECLGDQGRFAEGEPLMVGAYEVLREVLGEDSPRLALAGSRMARFYRLWGRPEEGARFEAEGEPGRPPP